MKSDTFWGELLQVPTTFGTTLFSHGVVCLRRDEWPHFVDEETEVKRIWSNCVYQGEFFVKGRIKNKIHDFPFFVQVLPKSMLLLPAIMHSFAHYKKRSNVSVTFHMNFKDEAQALKKF